MTRLYEYFAILLVFSFAAMVPGYAQAGDSPQAYRRTFGSNFRDMVLANCVATAYKRNADVGKDAGSSVTALVEWTYYDMEQGPGPINALVQKYLSRDYFNPLAEAEVKGIRFDFLKCLDLYHSKDLDRLVKQLVSYPNDTIRSRTRREKY